jgi:hypothetical protein
MIATRLQAESREQRGGIEGSEMLVTSTAATALEFIGSEKAHVPTDAGSTQIRLGRFPDLTLADRHQQHRTQKSPRVRMHRESIMELFRLVSLSGCRRLIVWCFETAPTKTGHW